jgi:TatA/E family protein of Tat protein translocase
MSPIFAFIDAPIIAVIIGLGILLFGADKIPKLARSMGEAKKEFESASRGPGPTTPSDVPPPAPPPTSSPQTPAPPQ